NESVRISRGWVGKHFGEVVYEERKSEMGQSGFDHWKALAEFSGEVMADMVRERNIQVVTDPERDKRCFRDGRLVSQNPFILVPELVNGELRGAYKLDFHTGELECGELEQAFIDALLEVVDVSKAKCLAVSLSEDFSQYATEDEVINWALVLMTGGGFSDMPRYAAETNRAALFLANEAGELFGKQAIGDISNTEFASKIDDMSKYIYKEGVQKFLRRYDQSQGRLNLHIAGKIIGPNLIHAPIRVEHGIDIFDHTLFNGAFDARKLRQLKGAVEELFAFKGKNIDNYMLLPVKGRDGNFYGMVYVDNAFSDKPLFPEKDVAIIQAAVERIAAIRSARQK
ncbi:MAG: hypothetical protein PHH60_00155, partial [Candidatus Margulisbacteria bacterium]|nr:hypothetical protein [Candidatus Margulisiibacteriota bacterium]